MLPSRLSLSLSLLLPVSLGGQDALLTLAVDHPQAGMIDDGAPLVVTEALSTYSSAPTVGLSYLVVVDEDVPVTIELRSYFFDAYLVLRDASGHPIAEDDDGLIDTHARVVAATLLAGKTYHVEACALHGERGAFEIVAIRGEPPARSETELADIEIEDARRRVRVIDAARNGEGALLGQALHKLGMVLTRYEADEEALPIFERAVLVREAALGPNHKDVGTSVENLGITHWILGDKEAARPYYERTLAIHEIVYGPDHPEVALSLDRLAGLHNKTGDPDAARPLMERSLSIYERAYGSHHAEVALSVTHLANFLADQQDFADARPLYERALSLHEAAYGPDHSQVAIDLNNLAHTCWKLGDLDAARALYERSLAIRKVAYGPGHLAVAIALVNLSLVLDDLGEPARARAALERALSIQEAALGPDHVDVGVSLGHLAKSLRKEGDFTAARALFERALSIGEAAYGPDHRLVSRYLCSLADVLVKMADYAAALPLYERALAIDEAVYGASHLRVATTLNALAVLLVECADYDAARPMFERSLAIREALLGVEHSDFAQSLNNLASLHLRFGDRDAARRLFERSVTIRESLNGPDHPDVSIALGNLAVVLDECNDYAAARPLHERVLAIRESAYGEDDPLVANTLLNLAGTLRRLGDGEAARSLQERALAICEAYYGLEHPLVAGALDGLAFGLRTLGENDEARQLLERSLSIRHSAQGPDHPDLAATQNHLALLLRDLGENGAARTLATRSMAIREASLGSTHLYVSDSLRTLALLHQDSGENAAARPLLERALAIREAAFGPEDITVAEILGDLARLCLDAGDLDSAVSYAGRLGADRGQVRRTLASLTTGESYLYLASKRGLRDTLLAAAAAAGDTERAYTAVLEAKGQVARLTLQTREQLRRTLGPETLAMSRGLAAVQARLSRLALTADVLDRDAHETEMTLLRERRDAIDRALRRSAELVENTAVTPGSILNALPVGTAVVDLLEHPTWIPARFVEDVWVEVGKWSEPRMSAWVLVAGRDAVLHVDLGPSAPIAAATAVFLEDLVSRRGMAATAEEELEEDANATLRALVWEPVVKHLGESDTIFLSPDGALSTLPFETLQSASGDFLIERYAFVYPTEVASMATRPATVDPLADRDAPMLAIGGVDFRRRADPVDDGPSREPASRSTSTPLASLDALRGGLAEYWGRLPATEYESQVVTDMHADAFLDHGRSSLLQGADATEERLKAEMPQYAILHLATHGFFQPEGLPSMWEAANKAVGDARGGVVGGGLRMTEQSRRLTGLHPGLLSGLVLAGANRPLAEGDPRDDGYLTASEVTLLDLGHVELVVLSACETGLGRPQSGEGLLGLRRAFHMAGADTVISSLWSVKDESTSELMQSFYANLFFKGMGRNDSLRRAQLTMLAKNRARHGDGMPSTWGAFVLSGEWR